MGALAFVRRCTDERVRGVAVYGAAQDQVGGWSKGYQRALGGGGRRELVKLPVIAPKLRSGEPAHEPLVWSGIALPAVRCDGIARSH